MTSEQRDIIQRLVITPRQRTPSISEVEFVRLFPSAIKQGKLATDLLETALREKSAEDLQCSLIVGFTFGFDTKQKEILCRLLEADWHYCHEDLVTALHEVGNHDHSTVESLYQATQNVPHYLSFDESRALAVKAIWALGGIAGGAATEKLRMLAQSDEPILRDEASNQLSRREGAVGGVT